MSMRNIIKPMLWGVMAVVAVLSIMAPPVSSQTPEVTIPDEDTICIDPDSVYIPGFSNYSSYAKMTVDLDSLRSMYAEYPSAIVFAALPDSITPLLPQNVRLDMIDYAKFGSRRSVKNAMDSYSRIDSISARYLKAVVTTVSNIQVGIYGEGKGKQIVVVDYTITPRDAAADSELLFYNTDMQPIPLQKVMKLPDSEDFIAIPHGKHADKKELARQIPFSTVAYSIDPSVGTITATLTADVAMTVESLNILKPFLNRTLVYHWTGKKFELQKKK